MTEALDLVQLLQKGAPSDVILIVIGYVVNMVVKYTKQSSKNTEANLNVSVEIRDLMKLFIATQSMQPDSKRKNRGLSPTVNSLMQNSLDKTSVILNEKA